MSDFLSQRVSQVKPSPTLAVSAKAAALKALGKDIISLGTGEPDFDTPEAIKAAAIKAIEAGKTKYTPVDGTPSLKAAILEKFAHENDLRFALDEILVSVGAKQCLYNLMQATLNAGDEVIIPAPYWVSYPDMAKLAQATPVIVPTTAANRFKITAQALSAAITPKTKLVILNSPSNPTGMAYSEQELGLLADCLLKHPNIIIVTDDIYEHILWGQPKFANILMVNPKLRAQTVVINGVSKAYAMTGWRIGYAAGPAVIIKAMKKIQSQSTSNPTSIAQWAAEAALKGGLLPVKAMVAEFKARHDYVQAELDKLAGISCLAGDGTFYLFPNVKKLIDKTDGISTDIELAEQLLEKAGIALVPGTAFGCPGHLRFSFATSIEQLDKALARLAKFIQEN